MARYPISPFDEMKLALSAIDDDMSLPWETYPCLETAHLTNRGYGVVQKNGKACRTHRAAYELVFGTIPDGLSICHRCDNPKCFRPIHLFAGTHQENMKDRDRKGRRKKIRRGEANGNSKFKEAAIREIWTLRAQGLSQVSIGERLGIPQPTVSAVLTGKIWRHIKPEVPLPVDSRGQLVSHQC